MREKITLLAKTSPQIHDRVSTSKIMWSVVLCLVPAGIWGVYVFGLPALYVIIASIAASLIGEYIAALFYGKVTLFDGSAFLTGLLVAYNMPPSIPLYIPVIASLFAILVVKWSFGGLGANWMNPALAGRVFVFFSWTGPMTSWLMPRTLPAGADAVSGPSPLGFIKTGLLDFNGKVTGSIDFLNQNGYPRSIFDGQVTAWLNAHIFTGKGIGGGYIDLFVGNVPGSLGEISALLLLLGTVYLFIKKIITWEIPAAYLVSFGLLTWIFGGLRFGNGLFSGDIVFHFLSGGLILGIFYMATDMVTSPLSRKGMLVFGVGAGFFTFLIRFYGSVPEGVSLSIIIMNIFVPLIDRVTGPVRFGLAKKGKEG